MCLVVKLSGQFGALKEETWAINGRIDTSAAG
jgi:hypothetical protein